MVSILIITEGYAEPCQTSKMELLVAKVKAKSRQFFLKKTPSELLARVLTRPLHRHQYTVTKFVVVYSSYCIPASN